VSTLSTPRICFHDPATTEIYTLSYTTLFRSDLLPVSIAPEDSMNRSYIALTVGYLDVVLDHFTDLATMFGATIETVDADLPSAYPVNYGVKRAVMQTSTIKPKKSKLSGSKEGLVQRILAKKAGGTTSE